MTRLCVAVIAVGIAMAAPPAAAQCQFDDRGTITNPDEPSCRDARFVYTESDLGGNNIALGYPVPTPIDSLSAVDGFRTYASLHARHQDLMMTRATIAGHIVGQTLDGRSIWAYTLGDADAQTVEGSPEPAMMVNGGIHAREWQSPEVVTEVLEQLIETSDDDGLGRYLSDNVNVVIIPVLNIDGFIQTQLHPASVAASAAQPRDGRMRRKNLRHPTTGGSIDNDMGTSADQYFGVDLNRNSRHGFGLNNGSLDNTISLIYRGSSHSSEPEIQALIQGATLGPAAQLRFYTDVHSFTRVFFIPSTANARRNIITTELANRMRAVTGNRYRSAVDPFGAQIGTTADYFAIEYDIPSWTWEVEPRTGGQDYGGTGVSHSGFILPDSEIGRVRDEIAAMALLGFFRQAGPPAVSAVRVVDDATGATAFDAQWVNDATGRTLDVSSNAPLRAGSTYRLWLAFNKPMRYSTDGVTPVDYPGQIVAPFPEIALQAGPNDGDLSIDVTGTEASWLSNPGGAPDGYRRYRFDALAATFTVPANAAFSGATSLVLSVAARDLSLMLLDADPSTASAWADGHWTGWEDALGNAGDRGGTDCSIGLFGAPAGVDGPAPSSVATCKAAAPPPPPPPSVPPLPVQTRSGGGAHDPLLVFGFLAWILGCRWTRRR